MSPRTLDDAFVIPAAGALQALDFVIRLDRDRAQDAVQRLIDDYVVTPAVADALPGLFHHLHKTVQRCEAYGHILHGGFGSGKSHLMTVLSLLLEGHPAAWAKEHPTFATLRERHQSWIADANLLVVRVHMLSARRAGARLDDILYDAVNHALEARGKAPLLVSGSAEVLAEIKREGATFGQAFWDKASAAGVAGSLEELEALEAEGPEVVDVLAQQYLAWKGRAGQAQGLKPAWGEGLKRLAKHIKGQGYGGLVLLVDEFLLWLAEKAGDSFVEAINDMNTIVDFSGRREAPVVVVFARQRNIREFFPDLTDQDRIQERVDHHAKRFEVTQLQDVELRYIVKGRVLRDKKDPAAVDQARRAALTGYQRALDDLVGEAGPAVLEDVYPFHPALIDVLVDVSNLLQRERSALRLLYEVLAANRDLPLGDLLPVGRLFPHVFPPAGVEAAQKTEVLERIHREWYGTLAPKVDAFVQRSRDDGSPVSDDRAHALRQAVKTVLLGLVSPRLAGKGNERLTVARLAKLNFADADGSRLKSKINRLGSDLTAFALHWAPELQVTGTGIDAVVSYALGQASLGEVLRRAQAKVDNEHALQGVLGDRLDALLPKKLAGIVPSGAAGTRVEVIWRGTRRVGRVVFGNVRVLPQKDFKPGAGEAFRVLLDYPWDKPGHTVGEDIAKVENARKKFGRQPVVAWLPRHFTVQEQRLLRELAALQWLLDEGAGGELLSSYGRDERTHLLEQARTRARTVEAQVDKALAEAYGAQAEVKTLIGPRDPDLGAGTLHGDLVRLAREILDRQYPQHPAFQRTPDDKRHEVKPAAVRKVEGFLRQAWGQSGSVHFSTDTSDALSRIAKPLELADVGQSRAQITHYGRFVKVLDRELGDLKQVAWQPIADLLRGEPYGLPDELVDLLLVYVCLKGYRARTAAGDPVAATVGAGARVVTLQKAELLSLPQWSRARLLGEQLLGVRSPDAHRSLSAQDALASALERAAQDARRELDALRSDLSRLGALEGERVAELQRLRDLLAPLTTPGADSHARLAAWLEAWPTEDASLRTQLRSRHDNRTALDELNRTSRKHLLAAQGGRLAARVADVLGELDERLVSTEHVRPLRRVDVAAFNDKAGDIVNDLLKPDLVDPGGPTPDPRPRPRPAPGRTRQQTALNKPSADDLRSLLDELLELQAQGRLVSVDLTTVVVAEEP